MTTIRRGLASLSSPPDDFFHLGHGEVPEAQIPYASTWTSQRSQTKKSQKNFNPFTDFHRTWLQPFRAGVEYKGRNDEKGLTNIQKKNNHICDPSNKPRFQSQPTYWGPSHQEHTWKECAGMASFTSSFLTVLLPTCQHCGSL